MFKDLFKNPFTIFHAVFITISVSLLTIIEQLVGIATRSKIDNRLRWWSKSLLKFIDLEFKVLNPYNTEFEENKAYIVMCNHCSYYDIPLSLMALPGSIRMLAKKELLKIPVWGKAMRRTDFVSIDRFNPRQALKDMKYAKTVMERGIILWIAPEGTRSVDGKLQKLKPGGFRLAIETGATIVPLGIKGSEKIMATNSFKVKRGSNVEVRIGRAIDASTYNKRQRDELMEAVEKELKKLVQPELQIN